MLYFFLFSEIWFEAIRSKVLHASILWGIVQSVAIKAEKQVWYFIMYNPLMLDN